tara:strand:+ start:2344 stop:3444 length:1101 start_codon:yes stop_codon:yes gene_type:complete
MKNLQTANKGLKALAKENPSLVEDKFGYDVPGYTMGGIAQFFAGGVNLIPGTSNIPVMDPNSPTLFSGKDVDFTDVFDKDAQDEAQEDLDDFIYDFEEDGGIDAGTRDPDQIAKIIKDKKTPKEKMQILGEMLEMVGASSDFSPLVQSQIIKGSQASIPEIRRLREGGIAGLPFDYEGDFKEYMRDILGINYEDDGIAEDMVSNIARAYGAGSGIGSLGYRDTRPGASISIDAKDVTPDVYRFYPSEVSKIYAQAKGVPFSPLVAPPREATYVDALQPRRIASQLYAKDGTFVDRDELVTGPGGEKGDKIPAMLSDGEFVTNSAAVRGMGIAAGADPNDEYEQRLIGAREMYKMQKFGEEIAKQLV